MVFSSIPFLYYFLPAVLILYFIAGKRFANLILFAASLAFYAWGEPKYVFLMLGSTFLGYLFAILIEKSGKKTAVSKILLFAAVGVNVLALCVFKYADFAVGEINSLLRTDFALPGIALPIGISFYTFQILSYCVDVYRGDVAAQKNFISFAAYVTMFPQLIAGPIVRYSDIEKQLARREHSLEKIYDGLRRFTVGLSKKVLLANRFGELCEAFKASDENTVLYVWLYAAAYSLHVYFDFSGYSDMAIGLGKIFGFDFCENFNYPYISKSATEFWRRWHMSLGTWFRDYVYIPMGGNRVGFLRWIFNIFTVWALTGLWHGASRNFVVWGLYFAVLLVLEKLFLGKFLKKIPRVFSHIYTLLAVVVSFVIFDSENFAVTGKRICAMFGFGTDKIFGAESLYMLKSFAVPLAVGIIAATPVSKLWRKKFGEKVPLETVFCAVLLIIVTAYLADGSYNPFLYFRF